MEVDLQVENETLQQVCIHYALTTTLRDFHHVGIRK